MRFLLLSVSFCAQCVHFAQRKRFIRLVPLMGEKVQTVSCFSGEKQLRKPQVLPLIGGGAGLQEHGVMELKLMPALVVQEVRCWVSIQLLGRVPKADNRYFLRIAANLLHFLQGALTSNLDTEFLKVLVQVGFRSDFAVHKVLKFAVDTNLVLVAFFDTLFGRVEFVAGVSLKALMTCMRELLLKGISNFSC